MVNVLVDTICAMVAMNVTMVVTKTGISAQEEVGFIPLGFFITF